MKGVIEYLERSAERYPDKTAIAYEEVAYTFAELRDAARQWGAVIASAGASGEPVGVFCNRGTECIVAFMAAAYSGNYYLALDPDLPAHKLSVILEDSGATVLVGMADNTELVDTVGFDGTFIALDGPAPRIMPIPEAPEVEADSPLCLIYTSGSTGKPKGVLKSHGAFMAFIEAFAAEFGLGADEVIGNQTPFFFDASAKDLYLMLYTGATMEIIPSSKFVLPVTLIEYINERHVTYACWVPTAFAGVTQLKTFNHIKPTDLRHVFFVGEVFPLKQLRNWCEQMPQLEYVNLFGSTELAGICCFYRVDPAAAAELEVIPMGKPLPGCDISLVAEDGSVITEPDVIGEVCLQGPTIALGYYKDPERTAERFVAGEDGVRLMTGDLARYDAEGNLVFASRKDFQIKHQGRRIELGEIEAAADKLPEIQRCACVYHEEKKKIVLFAELMEGAEADQKSIRAALRAHLSEYMVPGKVAIVEALPYNANGKIDRPALRALL